MFHKILLIAAFAFMSSTVVSGTGGKVFDITASGADARPAVIGIDLHKSSLGEWEKAAKIE